LLDIGLPLSGGTHQLIHLTEGLVVARHRLLVHLIACVPHLHPLTGLDRFIFVLVNLLHASLPLPLGGDLQGHVLVVPSAVRHSRVHSA